MKKIIFLACLLLSSGVFAQTIPLNQKQWYVKSKVGSAPPKWSVDSKEYVNNTGFEDSSGNMCIGAADANCYQYVNIGGFSSSSPIDMNLISISGNTPNTNGGNRDAGTLTVTLADDDPAVTSLGVMDDWDSSEDVAVSSDGVTVMVEARTSQKAAVDDRDAVIPVANTNGEIVVAGYSWTTNSIRSEEQDPISTHHEEGTLYSLTNISTNTTGYCGYVDMDGKRFAAFQIETSGTAPTDVLTVTFECTVQDDGTAPASCTYQDLTNDLFGIASVVDSDDMWIVSSTLPMKYCRIKYVTSNDSGNDADLTVFYKLVY